MSQSHQWEFIRAISFNLQGNVTEQAITFDQAHKHQTMSAWHRSLICCLPELQKLLLVCLSTLCVFIRTYIWCFVDVWKIKKAFGPMLLLRKLLCLSSYFKMLAKSLKNHLNI